MWLQTAQLGGLRCTCAIQLRPRSLSLVVLPRNMATTRPVATRATAEKAVVETPPETFKQLRLTNDLVTALESLNISKPTEIQALAVSKITKGGNFILASHTGSGKTLAYLLPLVEQLKRDEQSQGVGTRPKRPKLLVLGPTKELTDQITSVAKSLSHFARLRVQRQVLSGPVDLLVGTPRRVMQHADEGNLYFGDVQWLVLDEADTMFDQGFGPEVRRILTPCREKPQPANVILVSATMTKAIKKLIGESVPDVTVLETSSVHRAVVGSRHQFQQLGQGKDKLDLLQQVMEGDVRKGRKVLVFTNTMDSCRAVEYFCRERGIATVCYHGDMPGEERRIAMEQFTGASTGEGSPTPPVMIATDLAARGLDFGANVNHVINFDFPSTSVDYLHRSGRTARAGAPGKISSLISARDRVLAQRIEWALQHGEPLDQLSSDPEILPPSQRAKQPRYVAPVPTGKYNASKKKLQLLGRTRGDSRTRVDGRKQPGGRGRAEAQRWERPAPAGRDAKAPAGKERSERGAAASGRRERPPGKGYASRGRSTSAPREQGSREPKPADSKTRDSGSRDRPESSKRERGGRERGPSDAKGRDSDRGTGRRERATSAGGERGRSSSRGSSSRGGAKGQEDFGSRDRAASSGRRRPSGSSGRGPSQPVSPPGKGRSGYSSRDRTVSVDKERSKMSRDRAAAKGARRAGRRQSR